MNRKNIPAIEPVHPGAILREDVLPALKKSKTEIAKLLGISRQHLYDILDEKKDVTPEMAVRIGKLCGNGAEFWLSLQMQRDLWKAEKNIDASKIPTLAAA